MAVKGYVELCQIALLFHYYEGYTIAEMAELLGENPNTVSARLGRARKKLKLLLEEGMCHG